MIEEGEPDAKHESSSSGGLEGVDEGKLLVEKDGCWCPGYEDHPSKEGVCRNCGHFETEHNKEEGLCKHTNQVDEKDRQQEEKRRREEEKNRTRRKNINREIFETERSYLDLLRKIKVYRTKLESCLDEKTIWSIFSNSDSLLDLHEDLFSKLEQCTLANDSEPCFGPIFVSVGPSFRLYKMYAAAHENALKVIRTIVENEDALNVCKSIIGDPNMPPRDAMLELNSLLIAPIQRIPRYLLLLQDLIKHSTPGSSDHAELEKAHKIIMDVAGQVNTYVSVEEDMNKVIQIQETLIGDFPPLYGKRFIYEGDLNKITSRLVISCHMFLFDDIILYSHSKLGSFWRYKGTIDLGTAWVRVLEGGETYKNVFQIVGPKKTWTFYANSPEELTVWLDHLNGAISALVEKDPSLINKRADVSVKMGRGLWKILSINRRKDYDKEFSESLKNEGISDTASTEKVDDKTHSSSSSSSTSHATETEQKTGSNDEKKSEEVEELKSKPEKRIKVEKKRHKRLPNGYCEIGEDSYEDEDEEEYIEPKKDNEKEKQKPSGSTAALKDTVLTTPANYSTVMSSAVPSAIIMQDDTNESFEGGYLLGSSEKPKKKKSCSWLCC